MSHPNESPDVAATQPTVTNGKDEVIDLTGDEDAKATDDMVLEEFDFTEQLK